MKAGCSRNAMIKYVLTEGTAQVGGQGEARVCGITAVEDSEALDEIADISADRELVCRMADMLTRCEVSIIHFRDVVEDLLAQT